jgi:predicted P-loop ATPase
MQKDKGSNVVPLQMFAGWKDSLQRNGAGQVAKSKGLENAVIALEHAPELRGIVGFDEFQQAIILLKSPPWRELDKPRPWLDVDDSFFQLWLSACDVTVGKETAQTAVEIVGHRNSSHPLRTWLNALEWDGLPRIDTWLTYYLGVEDSDFARDIAPRWLVQAVARVMAPGCKADHVLILEGGQGIGKSSALRVLAGRENFTDELGDLGSHAADEQLQGVWIVELGELDQLSRSEVIRANAFLTRTVDRFRPAYGRRVRAHPRQCVFAGTTNHAHYLRDDTGGRRFWPVTCRSIDLDALANDRDQIWAEAVARYQSGDRWWLDSHEAIQRATETQEDRYQADPWESIVGEWLALRSRATITDILGDCLAIPKERQDKRSANRVAAVLRRMGWQNTRQRDAAGTSVRVWGAPF